MSRPITATAKSVDLPSEGGRRNRQREIDVRNQHANATMRQRLDFSTGKDNATGLDLTPNQIQAHKNAELLVKEIETLKEQQEAIRTAAAEKIKELDSTLTSYKRKHRPYDVTIRIRDTATRQSKVIEFEVKPDAEDNAEKATELALRKAMAEAYSHMTKRTGDVKSLLSQKRSIKAASDKQVWAIEERIAQKKAVLPDYRGLASGDVRSQSVVSDLATRRDEGTV